MHKNRPVFLDLTKIKFPIMAIISILHRASGFLLFFAVPLFLWTINLSLESENSFMMLKEGLAACLPLKVILFIFLSALVYHLFAGIRHLFIDWGWFETLPGARATSWIVIFLSALFIILLGIVLW